MIDIYNPKVKTNIEKLKNERIKAGLTQDMIAKAAHITKWCYQKVERGTSNPKPTTAKSICDVLKIKFDDIFSIENSE